MRTLEIKFYFGEAKFSFTSLSLEGAFLAKHRLSQGKYVRPKGDFVAGINHDFHKSSLKQFDNCSKSVLKEMEASSIKILNRI